MKTKEPEKIQAIALRKQGLSYSEILVQIPVAKSTLSLWLRNVGLAKRQAQRLTDHKRLAGLRGGQARRDTRLRVTEEIMQSSAKDIGTISPRELFLIGISLYWAEGAKEKEYRRGSDIQFSNSDADMVRLFLRWLTATCNVDRQNIYFDLYVHENHKYRIPEIVQFWAHKTGYPTEYFTHIYFKKHKPKTNRLNIGPAYYGLVKVRVRSSSPLLRKVAGWTKGVIEWADK